MSTRCEIGILKDGKIKVIYNHYDGYLDGVGKDLITDWNSEEFALKVVDGEYNNEDYKYEVDTIEEWLDALNDTDREYAYLWKDGEWIYAEMTGLFKWPKNTKWKSVIKELNKMEKK